MLIFLLLLLSTLAVVNGISCDSEFSCMNDTLIVNDESISCRGHASCAFARINNTDDSPNGSSGATQCAGRSSCQQCRSFQGNATFAGHIYGYLGLAWTKYVNITDDNVICYGEGSCYNLGTAYLNNWWCNGVGSCANYNNNPVNENLNSMKNLYGRALLSNKNSILQSTNNINVVNIYMGGAFAGYNTTISCQANTTCNLFCKTSGCIGLTFVCDDKVSSCSIECNNITNICPTNGNTSIVNKWIDIMQDMDVNEGYLMSYFEKEYSNKLFDLSYECNIECGNTSTGSNCYEQNNLPHDIIITSGVVLYTYSSCYVQQF